MKQLIKLTESDLHRIINQCVNEALDELDYNNEQEIEEGIGNWVRAGINGLSNIKKYSQGASNSKLVNFADNVRGEKNDMDDIDAINKANKYEYQNAPSIRMAKARLDMRRGHYDASQNYLDAKRSKEKSDSRRNLKDYDSRNGTNLYQQRYKI